MWAGTFALVKIPHCKAVFACWIDATLDNAATFKLGPSSVPMDLGLLRRKTAVMRKVPQTGNVVIEDDCDIGALTTIDRATLGSTVLRKGCKLDNLIQIAHNVVIGEGTVMPPKLALQVRPPSAHAA